MPFTPTHVLAVVPISASSRGLPFSALAIGCMIPDLPLFFPGVTYAETHSPVGVITMCMPLGLVAFVVFQSLLKAPLVALLPAWFQRRMTSYSQSTLQPSYLFFFCAALAVTIGAYTHVVWDAFTHRGRWGTLLLPMLNQKINLFGLTIPTYSLLQHGSTLVGLPLLTSLWARQLLRTEPEEPTGASQLSSQTKVILSGILLLLPSLLAISQLFTDVNFHRQLFLAVTRSGALFVVLILGYALGYHAFLSTRVDIKVDS